jgi:hypothetical protein
MYALPQISFIAGTTQEFIFSLVTEAGLSYDASDCASNFAINHYINKSSPPIVSKACILSDSNAKVTLTPTDTLDLSIGKYEYQLSISDSDGNVDARKGVLIITGNNNKSFYS